MTALGRGRWAVVAVATALMMAVALPMSAQARPMAQRAPAQHSGTPIPSDRVPSTADWLDGVSCPNLSFCMATGGYQKNGGSFTLAEEWDGSTWSISPSPSPPRSALVAVSCTSPSFCMAVGTFRSNRPRYIETLVEMWDGTTWSVVPTPNPSHLEDFLNGVSCTSPSRCIAVGYQQINSLNPLFEAWNGVDWSVVTPSDPSAVGILDSISCTSPARCMAVGSVEQNGTFAETWDGKNWSVVPTPNPEGLNALLTGVSCSSASSCVAVGDHHNAKGAVVTLAEAWNGSKWSIVPSAGPEPNGINVFLGDDCPTASRCLAVGVSNPGPSLAEEWDGTRFSVVDSPNPTSVTFFDGVSCANAAHCTVVGNDEDSGIKGAVSDTLVVQWNGTTWTVVPSPNL
jgi:hypothetical protein